MEFVNNIGLKLPLLGLGTFSMHNEVLQETVEHCVNCGYSLFDTAQLYGNEEELWSILKQYKGIVQERLLFQTKIPGKTLQGSKRWLYLDRKSVKQQCVNKYSFMEGKLPDVFLFHSPFIGFERQYLKLLDLQQQYNVPFIGICNVGINEIKSLHGFSGNYPQIVQVEIHPYFSNRALVDFCMDNGIIVEARSPFAHGDAMAEWESEVVLNNLAQTYNKTVQQIILRWITQQHVIAISRTTKKKHVEENMNIFDFQLSSQEIEWISSLNKNKSYGVKTKYNN